MTSSILHRIQSSLSMKITIAVLLAGMLVAGLHIVLGMQTENTRIELALKARATALANFLPEYLDHQMERHEEEAVFDPIREVLRLPGVDAARLVNTNGVIKYSGNPDEVGTVWARPPSDSPAFINTDAFPRVSFGPLKDGVLTMNSELQNTGSCPACHSVADEFLGSIEVRIRSASVVPLLRPHRLRQAFTGIGILLVLCLVIIGLLRGLILIRIGRVREIASKVKSGELGARIGDDSPDELGRFSRQFDLMLEEIANSRRELEENHMREMLHFDRLATVGELSTSLAHEIRNPLAGVSAVLQRVLKSAALDTQNREMIVEANLQLSRLDETMRKLLAFTRTEDVNLEQVEINELIERTIPMIQGLLGDKVKAAGKTSSVETNLAHGLPQIRGDGRLLQQVLLNLVLNGLQAQGEKPAAQQRVIISTAYSIPPAAESRTNRGSRCADGASEEPRRCPNGAVRIVVRDFGPGLAEKTRREMFKPFFTTKSEGTGLGLSIARRIVVEHGGCLYGSNGDEGGAVMVVCLPVPEEGAQESNASSRSLG